MQKQTFIYASKERDLNKILKFIFPFEEEIFQLFDDLDQMREVAKKHRPHRVFIFSPGDTGQAVETQRYLRAIMPNCCVRILPSDWKSGELLEPGWRKVLLKALKISLRASKHLLNGETQ